MLRTKFFVSGKLRDLGYVLFRGSASGAVSRKYFLSNATVVNSQSIPGGAGGTAAGNATLGVFTRPGTGAAGLRTTKYTFSNDVVSAGGTLSQSAEIIGPTAAGNSEACIIALGATSTPVVTNRDTILRYAYADDSVSTYTSLPAPAAASSATGNQEFGIFRSGSNGVTSRFEYATGTRSTGPTLVRFNANQSCAHTGNGLIGLISQADSAQTNKITFASNTCTAGTALTATRSNVSRGMAGTVETGVFGMGGSNPCNLYSYASETTENGPSTFTGVSGAAVCASPQGVNV